MTVRYAAGPSGVGVGGAIRFKLPGLDLRHHRTAPARCSDPDVRLKCAHRLPAVNGKNGAEFFTTEYLFVTIADAPLRPGQWVEVDYGMELAASRECAPPMAQTWPVEVAVDPDGSRPAPGSGLYLVSDPPYIEFIPDRPARMELFVPSQSVVGRPFDAVARVQDRHYNLVRGHEPRLTLLEHATGRRLAPEQLPSDDGVYRLAGIVLDRPGIHRLVAIDETTGLYARSNPTQTTPSEPACRVYWGETHCHSVLSADEAASNPLLARPEGVYRYARDRAALDFCAVTDHVEDLTDDEWAETCQAARDAYEAGRFVTFSAFEATFQPSRSNGDKNVYFLSDEQPRVAEGTTQDLYADLLAREGCAMVIPHLHTPTNWSLHEPRLERVVEVYAHWGCGVSPESEPPIVPGTPRPAGSTVVDALERGARIGFIASADHSGGHPGDDFWWGLSSYNGGLAAVRAGSLTREGLWRGLYERRCYGTTRARVLLEFEVNGHAMGKETTAAAGEPRQVRLAVHGTAGIDRMEVVKNGQPIRVQDGDGRLDVELAFDDPAAEHGCDYYSAHVLQVDGEQAWASPVWVLSL